MNKRLGLRSNVVLIAISQMVGVLFVFAYMSILLNELGNYEYGVWLVITAVAGWLIQFDIGYSNGLRNRLTILLTNVQNKLACQYIGASFIYFSMYTVVAFVVLYFVISNVSFNSFFGQGPYLTDYLSSSILIVTFASLLHLLFGVTNSVAYSIHLAFIPPIRNMFFHGVILIGSLLLNHFRVPDVPGSGLIVLSWIYLGAVIISNAITNIYIYTKQNDIRPDFKNRDYSKFKEIMTTGSGFFLLQITAILLFTSDSLMITYFLGAEFVPEYTMTNKLFLFLIMMQGFLMAPLWSHYTKLFAEKKNNEVVALVSKTLLFSLMLSLLILPLLFLGEDILVVWTGDSDLYNSSLFYALGIMTLLRLFSSNYSTLFNGLGLLKFQIFHSMLAVAVNVLFTVFFLVVMHMGTEGVALGTLVALIPFVIYSPFYMRKIMYKHGFSNL